MPLFWVVKSFWNCLSWNTYGLKDGFKSRILWSTQISSWGVFAEQIRALYSSSCVSVLQSAGSESQSWHLCPWARHLTISLSPPRGKWVPARAEMVLVNCATYIWQHGLYTPQGAEMVQGLQFWISMQVSPHIGASMYMSVPHNIHDVQGNKWVPVRVEVDIVNEKAFWAI